MVKRNSSNQDFTNNADGFDLSGGTTPRKLSLSGANIAIAGAGVAVITFPAATSTLATLDGVETLTNKTLTLPIITQEGWIEVGSGGAAPAFQNNWVNFNSGYATCGFRKDTLGYVHLKGVVSSGTDEAVIFTLPAGYRPAVTETFSTISNDLVGRVDISSGGGVDPAITSNAWLSLSGITFKAA